MSTHNPHKRHNRRGLAVPIWFCIFALVGIGIFALCIWFDNAVRGGANSTPGEPPDPNQLIKRYRWECLHGQGDPLGDPCSPGPTSGAGTVEDPRPPGQRVDDDPGFRPRSPDSRGGTGGPGNPGTYKNR